jgi:serine protease Do
MGYTGTVTLGIISARDRDIKMSANVTLTNLFQTDTAINPGNSGGPLVTIEGELIGLNVAVRDGASNIAFTIPANKVRAVMAKNLPK